MNKTGKHWFNLSYLQGSKPVPQSCSRSVSLGRWPRYANSSRLTADG
ncbi:MAG: hypothetical protein F6K50_41680 [Moorea sp. SIO3I7]|nr:hypothetical protein [Moorena bouillonii]NEO01668.1 hypothetical protein [Moorena sp. SIO3I7]NEO62053.1 hypothetical protein [Moorena sp. SIO4G2]NEQ86687.1 hypothetical protein [Moorena sp. SIO2I5]